MTKLVQEAFAAISKLPPETHKYRLLAQDPHSTYKGGREWRVGAAEFPISTTITGVVLELYQGGFRGLHWHPTSDEWFYILDGELTVWVGGQVIRAPAGSFVFGPQGTPHTFTVSSAGGASFLLVTEPGVFEAFMLTCAEPAPSLTLPPPPSSPPDPAQIAALAAEYGIDILGPPGIPAPQH